MLVPLKIVLNFSRFKPAINRNRFWGDLRRGLNSLNSDTGLINNNIFAITINDTKAQYIDKFVIYTVGI